MRKIQIRKDLRLAIILICLVLIAVITALLYLQYNNPKFEEKKVQLYSYHIKDKVNYSVFLKPNTLYSANSLKEDQVYFSNLVDYIDAIFTYEFVGEQEAEIKGNYEIITIIEGYTNDGDTTTTLWQKQIPMIKKTNFNVNDKNFSVNKNISIRLEDFNALIKKISEESKVNLQTKATTYLNVELTANTEKGLIEKKTTTSLQVPIGKEYFKILRNQGEGKPEAIEEIKTIQRPINKNLIIGFGVGIGFLTLILLGLIFGSRATKIDPHVKELNKAFKKHGSRLVALSSEISATCEVYNKVKSLDDLVRVSDELGKPILYKHSTIPKKITEFYVLDDLCIYIYNLQDSLCHSENQYESSSVPKSSKCQNWKEKVGVQPKSSVALESVNEQQTLEEGEPSDGNKKSEFSELTDMQSRAAQQLGKRTSSWEKLFTTNRSNDSTKNLNS